MAKKILISVELSDSIDNPIKVHVPNGEIDPIDLIHKLNYGLKHNPRCDVNTNKRMKLHLIALVLAASAFEENVNPAEDVLMYSEFSAYARAAVKANEQFKENLYASIEDKKPEKGKSMDQHELIVKNLIEIGRKMNIDIVNSIDLDDATDSSNS